MTKPHRTLWSSALMFIEGYDMQALSYAAPAIIKAWHVDKAQFGPIFGFGLFGYMLGAMLLSNLADRIGRKKTIVGGAWLLGATGAGWAFGVGRIGSIVGPVLGGVLIALDLPIPMLFVCAAVPLLLAGATTWLLGWTPAAQERAAEAAI